MLKNMCRLEKACKLLHSFVVAVYLVTALVPSETACLANSPGRMSLTAVWMSLEVMLTVFFFPPSRSRLHNLEASLARRSKMSLQNELMTDMDLEVMPVSGWTCFSTLKLCVEKLSIRTTVFFLSLPSLLYLLTFSGLAFGTTDFSAFLEDADAFLAIFITTCPC